MTESSVTTVLRLARHGAALSVGVFGVAVLAAWCLHITPLLQMREHDAPAQFNLALALVLCAAALLAIERSSKMTAALGGVVTLLGRRRPARTCSDARSASTPCCSIPI